MFNPSTIRTLCFGVALVGGAISGVRAAQTPCGGPTLDIAPYVPFTWDPVSGALSYTVEIATNAAFTTGIQSIGVAGLATSAQATTLQFGTTYYWRLRSNSQEYWLPPIYTYHSVCSFSTIAAATQVPQFAPQQTSPANNSTLYSATTLTLGWNSYGGGTAYEVQFSTSPTMSTGVLTSPVTTALTWQPGPMTAATSYYWRVRAYNSLGAGSWANSPIWRFDTQSVATQFTFKVFLQGPLVTTPIVAMNDLLRSGGHLPTLAPYFYLATATNPTQTYTASRYPSIYAGPERGPDIVENELATISASDLAVTGTQAIVDWIVVEGRHGSTNSLLRSWVMLVRRDGSVVFPTGTSLTTAPSLIMPMKNMKFAIRHRNHLGAMTANAVDVVGTPITVDFTSTGTALLGTNPTFITGSTRALWAGDCNADGTVKYSGSNNDRDKVLQAIGGIIPTNFLDGYRNEDASMNGRVLYSGGGNDRDLVLSVIGGVVPTATRTHQLP